MDVAHVIVSYFWQKDYIDMTKMVLFLRQHQDIENAIKKQFAPTYFEFRIASLANSDLIVEWFLKQDENFQKQILITYPLPTLAKHLRIAQKKTSSFMKALTVHPRDLLSLTDQLDALQQINRLDALHAWNTRQKAIRTDNRFLKQELRRCR